MKTLQQYISEDRIRSVKGTVSVDGDDSCEIFTDGGGYRYEGIVDAIHNFVTRDGKPYRCNIYTKLGHKYVGYIMLEISPSKTVMDMSLFDKNGNNLVSTYARYEYDEMLDFLYDLLRLAHEKYKMF